MGWRFRKSVKILPGVRLNFGKGGFTSTTIGGKWLKTNLSGRGAKHTFSVPGTGVSYQTDGNDSGARESSTPAGVNWLLVLLSLVLVLVVLVLVLAGAVLFLSTRNSTAQRPDFDLPVRRAPITAPASHSNI